MAPPNYASNTTSSHSSSSSSRPRQGYDVSSLGDPSWMSVTDCYTTPSPSEADAMRRRKATKVSAQSNAIVVASGTKKSGAAAATMLDLKDVRLTSQDTHQQTIIWNEMTASRRKLEEENQMLRDKLMEAQVANKVLRVKVKQHRGGKAAAGAGAGGGGGTLARNLDRGNLRADSRCRAPSSSSGLLQRVFSRRDAFRNPAAPGIKRFKVQAPRGLPLPSPAATGNKQVQHIFPLPDRYDDNYDPQRPYPTSHKSSIRSTRTPPAEIVVPAATSSPETVPDSANSSVASPTTSPSSSSPRDATPSLRQGPAEWRTRTHPYQQSQQVLLEQAPAYSLMRVVPLRRQGTTESTLTVHHSNHDGNCGTTRSGSSSSHRKPPPGPSLLCSAPDLPMLMEENEETPGCQTPSSTLMMIASSELPTSILERLAGAKIGSFRDDRNNDGSSPSAAIVLSSCTPTWYDPEDETRHYYATTHALQHHRSDR